MSLRARLVVRIVKRAGRARALATLLLRTHRSLLVALGLVTFVGALAPMAIVLATGALVAAASGAVTGGLTSSAGHDAAWALAAIATTLLVNGISTSFAGYVDEALGSRFVRTVHDTVAAAAAARRSVTYSGAPSTDGRQSATS